MKLLYFSPVNWHSYFQRPHYMVRHFLDCHPDNKVLWVNPYPMRFLNWQDFSRFSALLSQKKNTTFLQSPRIEIISPKALPIEPLTYSEKINYLLFWHKHAEKFDHFCSAADTIIGIGRPSKLGLRALQTLKYKNSFYDAMDDFPEFYSGYSRKSMSTIEKKISDKVKKIFVSSSCLAAKFPQATKIFNGYDMSSLPPVKIPQNTCKLLIFGFVGTIGQWFDWSAVIALAKQFPEAVIRLVGPQYVKYSGILPQNIEMLPECTQSDAVNYVSQFSVGLIPFKQNALTQGVDPIKYYEYHAMGLPVLSTRFGEMNYRNSEQGVYFFDQIKEALSHKESIQEIIQFRQKHDWHTRFSLCDFSV
jgi:hypothetical protein